MRTVRIKVYKFDELSTAAQQKAIDNYRNSNTHYNWGDENVNSMKKFAEIFPIKINDWSYGDRGEGVSFEFTCSDEIEQLSGQRLSTYIWNNYKNQLYKGKYYNCKSKRQISHPRVESIYYKQSQQWGNYYHSAITLEHSCVLTGYCMDEDILEPVYNQLDKPANITFKQLLKDCFREWVKSCNNDIEYQNSDEYIIDEIKANEYEYTKDGKRFY